MTGWKSKGEKWEKSTNGSWGTTEETVWAERDQSETQLMDSETKITFVELKDTLKCRKSTKKLLKILICVLFMAAFAGLALQLYFFTRDFQTKETTPTTIVFICFWINWLMVSGFGLMKFHEISSAKKELKVFRNAHFFPMLFGVCCSVLEDNKTKKAFVWLFPSIVGFGSLMVLLAWAKKYLNESKYVFIETKRVYSSLKNNSHSVNQSHLIVNGVQSI